MDTSAWNKIIFFALCLELLIFVSGDISVFFPVFSYCSASCR